jgi:tight adherence protein B
MLQSLEQNPFLILSMMVFVAVTLLLEGLYLIWKSYKGAAAKNIERRLNALSASRDSSGQTQLLKQRMLSDVPAIERLLLNLPKLDRIQRFIHQAGLTWTVSKLILSCAALGAVGFMAATSFAHLPITVGALSGTAITPLPLLFVGHLRYRRLRKIEQQLPDALDLLIRGLKAGHAFSSSLQMLGEEMAEPIAGEFRIVHDEVNFGVSLQQSLLNLCERVPVTDLRFFVLSVLIQRESGGNLTEVLANLSRLIRERLKLLAKVRVLSSEGRLSAWILGVIPFGIGGLLYVFNPRFMSPLWIDPIGITILEYLAAMMVFGILVLIKIVKIRV